MILLKICDALVVWQIQNQDGVCRPMSTALLMVSAETLKPFLVVQMQVCRCLEMQIGRNALSLTVHGNFES